MKPQTTACPLDCYDACRIVVGDGGILRGDKSHPVTRGYLCPHLNHFSDHVRIEKPRLNGQEISMERALSVLIEALRSNHPDNVLYYRGSGNVGLMQRALEHFFAQYQAVGTSGSLCDGAGEAGILRGRGQNFILSPQMISQSEVVVVWGRNIHVTHSHLLPFLEGKTLIVIDPVRTRIAQKADLYLQIRPHGDLYLALMLSRYAMSEGLHDTRWLDIHAPGYGAFYELACSVPVEEALAYADATSQQIGEMIALLRGKRTVVLVGAGIQKYRDGSDAMRAIDGFGVIMGLFGKSGSGVCFLGDSTQGLDIPFQTIKKRVGKPTVDFSKYNCVLVQGGNPLSQMPASQSVAQNYAEARMSVYFGLYENETSRASNLVIPAKTFLEKNDWRSSYGDYTLQEMPAVVQTDIGISEYDLAAVLCREFGFVMESEAVYLDAFRKQKEEHDGVTYRKNAPLIPYLEGFSNGAFAYLDTIECEPVVEDGFYLITSKHPRGLNSQFNRPDGVYFHPDAGFEEGCEVQLHSPEGSVVMRAGHDDRLRKDTLLIYSGTPGVNVLTPALLSNEGECAVYQEYKIKVEKIG